MTQRRAAAAPQTAPRMNVRIIEGYGWDDPIKLARHGVVKPLIDRLLQGEATAEEIATATGLMEGSLKRVRKAKVSAYEAFKKQAIAAWYLDLKRQGYPPNRIFHHIEKKLDRKRRLVKYALKKYKNDRACIEGKLITPWPDIEYFEPVLTKL
jgi:hypothetical protein